MQQLKEALANALPPDEIASVLASFRKQMRAWELTLPPAPPVVFDFGLGQFDRIGLIECWIANEVESGYCGKYLFVFDGQECPTHSHRVKHETFFVLKGQLRVILDGTPMMLRSGDVLPVLPRRKHSF